MEMRRLIGISLCVFQNLFYELSTEYLLPNFAFGKQLWKFANLWPNENVDFQIMNLELFLNASLRSTRVP